MCLSPSTSKHVDKPSMFYLFMYRTIRMTWWAKLYEFYGNLTLNYLSTFDTATSVVGHKRQRLDNEALSAAKR